MRTGVVVTIDHGDPERQVELDALAAVRAAAGKGWRATFGGNDWTAYLVDDLALDRVLAAVDAHRFSWWHVRVEADRQVGDA